eukprot:6044305-Prymnesium_polylepis.1
MNRAPFGGDVQIESSATPVIALNSTLTIRAVEWKDDPDDFPLSYSFAYAEPGVSSEKDSTSLGMRATTSSTEWVGPPEGNWSIIAFVYDSYLARARAEAQFYVEPTELSDAVVESVFQSLALQQDLQATSSTLQQ